MEFSGHKIIGNDYYSIRGNIIELNNIDSIIPEYHNNHRSIYLKVIKKSNGKNIIKMSNKKEYNYVINQINNLLNTNFEEI